MISLDLVDLVRQLDHVPRAWQTAGSRSGSQTRDPETRGEHYVIIPQDLVIFARFCQAAAFSSWSKVTVRY